MAKYPNAPIGNPWDMLAEECAEVIKERCKALRMGMEGCEEYVVRDGHLPPRERIIQEVGDILVVLDCLIVRKEVSQSELDVAKHKKWKRLYELFGEPKVEAWLGGKDD